MKTEISRIVAGVQKLLPDVPAQAVQDYFATPEISAVFDKRAAEALARRKALVARVAALPGEVAQRQAEAAKAVAAARERSRQADLELKAAWAAELGAVAVASSLGGKLTRDLAQTERDLIDSADPRIGEMLWQLADLHEGVRHVFDVAIQVDHHYESSGRSLTTIVTNHADVARACALIRELQGQCRAMQLQALAEDAITVALRTMALELAALLAPLGNGDGIGIDDTGAVVRQRVHKAPRATAPIPRPAGRPAQQQPGA